jgi:hypothetical protein
MLRAEGECTTLMRVSVSLCSYWRGAGNHASNELLSAENYAAYPRFRPAFAAYAVHAARAASNGAVPASKDRIDLDIRSVITLDQSKPNIVAAAAAANAATPGCDSDSSDPPCPISTRLSPSSDADAFRYALSVDGYSSAWRVHQLMASPTVLVKTDSVHEEWWYHLLQPYEHYVPVRADFTDFRRQLEWMEQHPEELARISVNSRRLMSKLFRPATFYCYTGELLHRYSQTVSVSQHPQPRSRFQLVRTHFLCRAARKFSLYSGIFGAACLAYWIGMAAIMVLVASRRNMLFTQRYLQ